MGLKTVAGLGCGAAVAATALGCAGLFAAIGFTELVKDEPSVPTAAPIPTGAPRACTQLEGDLATNAANAMGIVQTVEGKNMMRLPVTWCAGEKLTASGQQLETWAACTRIFMQPNELQTCVVTVGPWFASAGKTDCDNATAIYGAILCERGGHLCDGYARNQMPSPGSDLYRKIENFRDGCTVTANNLPFLDNF